MRVVIGEDEALLREGMTLMLERAGMDVVGVAADADELLKVVEAVDPEVVVTDIRMPPGHTDDGLRAAIAIRARHPGTGVVVLSQHVQRRYAIELLGDRPAGVGYLLKQRVSDAEALCRDVQRVGMGETVLDPEVVAVMLNQARRDTNDFDALTPRQLEVLRMVAEGRSNAAIARRLRVSEKAVVHHVSHIYAQLGLMTSGEDHRRVLAVVRYLTR